MSALDVGWPTRFYPPIQHLQVLISLGYVRHLSSHLLPIQTRIVCLLDKYSCHSDHKSNRSTLISYGCLWERERRLSCSHCELYRRGTRAQRDLCWSSHKIIANNALIIFTGLTWSPSWHHDIIMPSLSTTSRYPTVYFRAPSSRSWWG